MSSCRLYTRLPSKSGYRLCFARRLPTRRTAYLKAFGVLVYQRSGPVTYPASHRHDRFLPASLRDWTEPPVSAPVGVVLATGQDGFWPRWIRRPVPMDQAFGRVSVRCFLGRGQHEWLLYGISIILVSAYNWLQRMRVHGYDV